MKFSAQVALKINGSLQNTDAQGWPLRCRFDLPGVQASVFWVLRASQMMPQAATAGEGYDRFSSGSHLGLSTCQVYCPAVCRVLDSVDFRRDGSTHLPCLDTRAWASLPLLTGVILKDFVLIWGDRGVRNSRLATPQCFACPYPSFCVPFPSTHQANPTERRKSWAPLASVLCFSSSPILIQLP